MRKRKPDQPDPALFLDLETLPIQPQPAARPSTFFSNQRDGSAIKTKIVVDYFVAWANVMKHQTRTGKIGFFDFFCGPGVYEDGTESTEIQIMRAILDDERLRKITMTIFEDKDPGAAHSLSKAIGKLDGIDLLAHKPAIYQGESARLQIQEHFKSNAVIPTFMFLDPFGYVGLTRDLMRAILKDWGCEIVFYFNFNRINAALRNPKVRSHMDNMFGAERVEAAQLALSEAKDEGTRERIVIGAMRDALHDIGAKHVLQFGFRKPNGALDHHLVFATKNLDPAQRIMKDIMSRASSAIDADEVGSFEFNPAHEGAMLPLGVETPMQWLTKDLLQTFKGQRLSVSQIYARHNEGTPFTFKNYQHALRILAYDDQSVKVERGEFMPLTKANVTRRHMSEQYVITFPD